MTRAFLYRVYFEALKDTSRFDIEKVYADHPESMCRVIAMDIQEAILKAEAAFPRSGKVIHLSVEDGFGGGIPKPEAIVL